jgi:membrane protein YqaA with SNARE-associated domain
MLRKLYNHLLKLAGGPKAEPALFAVSFAESSFFPIPPDVMLAPMVLARPERAWRYALVCTIASIIGALLGYAIGNLLYDTIGKAIIGFFGYAGREAQLQADYNDPKNAFLGLSPAIWVILAKGLTPIPFKLVTIVSGFMKVGLLGFVAACTVTRAARFFLVAALFNALGPTLAPVIEKRIGLVALGVVILLVGGIFIATKLH